MTPRNDTLLLSWGNPGRRDDGLGPALTTVFADDPPPGVTVETDYQLQVERAADVANHQRVIFIDADRKGDAPFWVRRLRPGNARPRFSTHSVSPETVLALSRDLFDAEPEAWLIGVRGYEFGDFGEGLSERATANLEAAVRFVASACEGDVFGVQQPAATSPRDCEGEL